MPKEFPPYSTVQGYFYQWRERVGGRSSTCPGHGIAIQAHMRAHEVTSTATKQFITEGVVTLIRECRATGSKGVALRGYELLAKMGGHIVDKRDVRVVTSWEDLSDEELRVLAGPEPPGDDSAKGQS